MVSETRQLLRQAAVLFYKLEQSFINDRERAETLSNLLNEAKRIGNAALIEKEQAEKRAAKAIAEKDAINAIAKDQADRRDLWFNWCQENVPGAPGGYYDDAAKAHILDLRAKLKQAEERAELAEWDTKAWRMRRDAVNRIAEHQHAKLAKVRELCMHVIKTEDAPLVGTIDILTIIDEKDSGPESSTKEGETQPQPKTEKRNVR